MASKIKLKRSSVPNKTPQASQLELGELALNTSDGKVYLKKEDGSVLDTSQQIFQRNTEVKVQDNGIDVAQVETKVNGVSKIVVTDNGTEFTDAITIGANKAINFVDDSGNEYVGIQAPDNVDYSYILKLPSSMPVEPSVLANDGQGNLSWGNADTFGGNRIYASDAYGNDANDGVTKPVKTLKRAAQLAASLGLKPLVEPSVDAYNAKRLLEDNRAYIQEETIGFINWNFVNFNANYEQETCERDSEIIIDAVSYDLALGTNYNSVTSGLAYQRANSAYVKAKQKIQTVGAISYIKAEAADSLASNATAVSRSNAAFTEIIDIIQNGVAAADALVFPNPTGAAQSIIDAKTALQSNKEALKTAVTDYINDNFIGYIYADTVEFKCRRDIGYILTAVAYDIALGTNYNAITAGLAYRRANSAYVLSNQNIQTVEGIKKAKALALVQLASNATAVSRAITAFDEVIDILLNGEVNADALTFPTPTGAATVNINAKDLLQLNRTFIRAEIVAHVNDNNPPSGYDQTKCSRDVGYIVDALTYDLLYGGNSATKINAEAYFVGTAVAQLGLGQAASTISAYEHLQTVVSAVLSGTVITPTTGNTQTQDLNSNNFAADLADDATVLIKIIKDVIKVGNTTKMPVTLYPSLTWVNSGILDARTELVNNSATIVNTTSDFINTSFSNFTYNQEKCERDIGYIVDALTYDILYGGNSATITNARAYFVGAIGQLGLNQETVTVLAYNYLKTELAEILSGTEETTVLGLVDIINDVILAGSLSGLPTTVYPSLTWVDAGITAARSQLITDKPTIVTGTISFIDATYNGFVYNSLTCKRDTGLIIDAVIYDLILGGNKRSLEAGLAYYEAGNTSAALVVSDQKPETIAAIEFARELSLAIIKNETYSASYQNIKSQIKYPSLSGAAAAAQVTSLYNVVIDALNTGIGATLVQPQFRRIPITISVAAGDFYIDNPIIIPDLVSVVGDSLRSVVIRPLNANKDMFRVRNGAYMTSITFRDGLDANQVPSYTFNWSIAFDNPSDESVDRTGYFGLDNTKPRITISPYIQNCSIISFLAGNGIWVDGALVEPINIPLNNIESENPINLADGIPEQGKSMVANAFTMISFGGTGWFCTNDAYAQIVSCFQIFCLNGSYTQSGGYLSITNSATNFGVYALRSSGYSQNSFEFDRGVVAGTGTNAGAITLTTIGTKRLPVNQYIVRLKDAVSGADITSSFKEASTVKTFDAATDVNASTNTFTIIAHGYANGTSVVYTGNGNTPIPGLLEQGIYYVGVIDLDTFRLFNDDSLTYQADILATGTGTHKFETNVEEFFIGETISSHSSYQEITLEAGTYGFLPGHAIVGTTAGVENNAFVYSYNPATAKLIISNENTIIEGNPQRVLFTSASVITSISGTPSSINVDGAVSINNVYFTAVSQVISTKTGSVLQNPGNTLLQRINLHRPSIVNSSAHTWEFAGAGTDYNALPQNGGVSVPEYEQFSELPGRVYSSGTNELGDFKVGDFILAENKTGQITFRTRVSVGEIAVLKLSLSNVEVNEFSTDTGLGDNEPGGASDSRVSTQRAVRSFIATRLGNVIDKDASSNAVPGALVQLNSQGQINQDLLPPSRGVTTYNVEGSGSRLLLSEQIPAIQVISGDNASESYKQRTLTLDTAISVDKGDVLTIANPSSNAGRGIVKDDYINETEITIVNVTGIFDTTSPVAINGTALDPTVNIATGGIGDEQAIVDNFFLRRDTSSQYLILLPNIVYDFTGITTITGANSLAQGELQSTTPIYGVAVSLDNATLTGGTGYLPSSGSVIYRNVELTTLTGTGSNATANITVTNGVVTAVEMVSGGSGYVAGNTLSAAAGDIGGAGSGFEVDVLRADTRIYVNLVGSFIKFAATTTSPEYIEDANADTVDVTDLAAFVQKTFNAQDVTLGGNVNYGNSTITVTAHGFTDGDALVYSHGGNLVIGNLVNQKTYWVKVIDVDTVELYNNYAFTSGSKVTFGTASTGTHNFRRFVVNTSESTFNVPAHGLTTGEPIRFSATTPPLGLADGGYYYVGSITANGFTLHGNRSDAQASVNGVTASEISIGSTGTGTGEFTIQNVQIIGTVNTSSALEENWGQIAQATFDASNIVSGVIVPSRLAAAGSAGNKTFLRGDSTWAFAVQNVRAATNSPLNIIGDFYIDAGTNYYYNSIVLDINPADEGEGNPNYTNLGVVALNKLQFTVEEGETTIKSGVIDAGTLGGNSANYFTNPQNLVGTVTVNKGGTGLTSYTRGDILFSGSDNSLTQLTIGASNSVLTSNGVIPAWSTSLTLGGTLTTSGAVSINDTTASTSDATGALKVAGGVGVLGAIYAGSIQNTPIGSTTANSAAFTTLTASGNVTASGSNAVITVSPTGTGTVTVAPAGTLTLGTAGASTDLTGNVTASTVNQTVSLTPGGTGTVTIAPTTTVGNINRMNIGATTRGTGAFTTLTSNSTTTFTQNSAASSTTTGTLRVTGGVGITGAVYAGSVQNTPIGSTTASTGAFTTLTSNAATTFTAGTASTTTTTGTVVVTGGVGVSGAVTSASVKTTTLEHSGLTLTDGNNVDQLKTYAKSLTINTSWQDTGIKSTDLATGSYYMQIYANDNAVGGGHVDVYYSAIMSWYSTTTNETTWDEIVLNRAGSSVGQGALFVRLLRSSGSADNLKLQIAGTTINTGAATYTFKFRRLI
jgi:hypothetical protein